MKLLVAFAVELPDDVTEEQAAEWVRFHACGVSIDSELLDRLGSLADRSITMPTIRRWTEREEIAK